MEERLYFVLLSYQKLFFILKIYVTNGSAANDTCIHNSPHMCKHLMTLLYLSMWSCLLISICEYILSLLLILRISNVFQNDRVVNIYEIDFRILKEY